MPSATDAGTSRTLGSNDHGYHYRMTNSSLCTITLAADAAVSTEVVIDNVGTGGVVFVAASGATLTSLFNYTQAATNGTVIVRVISNNGGNSAIWKLMGEGL